MNLSTLLAGHRIASARFLGPDELRVGFDSPRAGHAHQLYAGRRLVADVGPGVRVLVAAVDSFDLPEFLSLVACDPARRFADHGGLLPPRPYNRPRLEWSASGSPPDADRWEVLGADGRVLARVAHEGDGSYAALLPPLPTGSHPLTVRARDGRPGGGNAGPVAATEVSSLSQPPDLARGPGGRRFAVAADAGALTIGLFPPA